MRRVRTLLSRRIRTLLLLALAAYGIAQVVAVAHISSHAVSDNGGLPSHSGQLCAGCGSIVPLLAAATGAAVALLFARCPAHWLPAPRLAPHPGTRAIPFFRSRAPPLR
jgi:hypothetical protein